MKYDYQYTFVAIIILIILLVINYQRRSYSSASNRIFLSLLYGNLLASAIDMVTYFTISYPERYSIFTLYFSNIIYLVLYSVIALTFFRYITVLTGDKYFIRISYILYWIVLAVESVLLCSTYYTHWIIYFDENLVYLHGRFFYVLYLFPYISLLYSLVVWFRSRKKFSHFQMAALLTLTVFFSFMSVFQMVNPRVDLYHLMITLVALVFYIIFENPAVYTYKNSRCFNCKAFGEEAEKLLINNQDPRCLLICVTNHPKNHSIKETRFYSALLEAAADHMKKCLGRQIFCIADGKFVMILTPKQESDTITQKCRTCFSSPLTVKGKSVCVHVQTRAFHLQSVSYLDDYVDHLIECVEQNSVQDLLSVPSLATLILNQHKVREVEDSVDRGLREGNYHMVYQPIYDTASGTFHSAEALIRLVDPDTGFVPPDLFIPIAEKNQSIHAIGELVLKEVCRFWTSPEMSDTTFEFVEMNVSPIQMLKPDMADRFLAIMADYGMDPRLFNIEITETSEILSNKIFRQNLFRLHEAGVTFSVDDYGSGFASVELLYTLPIRIVKVDKSILWKATETPQAMVVFEDTISMVKHMGYQTVVEGAESREMVDLIEKLGGDYIQGFFYSKPLEEKELIEFMKHAQ